MNAQLQNFFDNVALRARDLTGGTVTEVRNVTKGAAGRVKGAKGTVHYLGQRGLKLNELAFRYVDKMIKLQLKFVEASFEEGAKRLTTAANAPTLGRLVKDQVEMLPVTRDRITKNAQETLGLVKETRDGVASLFQPATPTKAKAARKPAARKVAKKVARKAPVKKAAAKKAPTRKVSRKKVTAKAAPPAPTTEKPAEAA